MHIYDPGTLVQVKPNALEQEDNPHWATNGDFVLDHGYLWMVDKWSDHDACYWCRSIATGHRAAWLPIEITEQTDATP